MKKTLIISLLVFWAAVTAILTAGLVFYQNNNSIDIGQSPANQISGGPNLSPDQPLVLTAQEIAKHAVAGDCWMIISGKVYNFTAYISKHPGGSAMTPYCGRDGTIGFRTKDIGQPHSSQAAALLGGYYLGDLNQTIGVSLQSNPAVISASLNASSQPAATSIANFPAGTTLNAVEIAKHASAASCWMVISGNVYDLTTYLSSHPGGSQITQYCGRDGTAAFNGDPHQHSSFATGLLVKYFIGKLNSSVPVTRPTPVVSATPVPQSTPLPVTVTLTAAETAKHNSATDCWMIISDKVYNLTSYIPVHPGGSQLTPYCGRDGTAAFFNGPPHAHSSAAANLLTNYLLGSLNASVTVTPTATGAAAPAPSFIPGDEDDADDD